MIIPRMSEELRNKIDVTEASATNSLMIYNLNEDCYNYYSRANNEWQSLCGKLGKAQFSIEDCSSVKVFGQYLSKESLGTSNYIKITVVVTKAGSYSVTGTIDPDNGYYFSTAGEFLTTGTFELLLQGAGTPKDFTPTGENGDLVKFNLNGIESECNTTYVKVEDSSIKPLYSMLCNTVKVNGVYRVNKVLDATNTISMQLEVDPAAVGATYIIETNTVDGIKFSGSGILTGGVQTVILYGSGKPTSFIQKTMTINSNSVSNVESCSATVIVAYSKKRILSIGTYSVGSYGYNFSGSNTNSNKLVTTQANFGILENSLVKIEGIEFIRTGDFAPTFAALQTALNEKPDIVILGVWWNPTVEMSQLLVDYLAKGGVLLGFMEETGTTRVLQAIFADNSINGTLVNAAGAIYQLPYVNDEVLNGPFGDIRGKQWGEDASQTRAITNLPGSQITIYSNANNISGANTGNVVNGMVTSFRHNTLNMIFVCDGGFNSGTNMAPLVQTYCPFNINAANFPIPKDIYGNGSTKHPVYNSSFTANSLAWAFRQAQFNGINK